MEASQAAGRSTCAIDWLALAATLALAAGCASLKRDKGPLDSVAECRQLSHDAMAAMERGQADQARALLEQAVAASPSDLDARRQLAEALWQTGARQEAAVHIEAAVRLEPRHTATVVRSGEMLLSLGAVNRAQARAEEAIALDPTLPEAWALRGRVFKQRGEPERALADLQHALRYDGDAVEALIDAAELQLQLGRPQRSLTTVQQAIACSPQGTPLRRANWVSGLAYRAVNRPEEAVSSLYAASIGGSPNAVILYELASAQQAAGRADEATTTVRQALAADGQHAPSRALLAQLAARDASGADATLRR
jgi:tetratricopeptide (TPR) repeat protein